MRPFELAEPRSLREAIDLLDAEDPAVRAGGGCTALMLMLKAGVLELRRLVSLRRIEAHYGAIECAPDAIRIGGQCTLTQLEHDSALAQAAPVLVATLRTLANVRVRNVATLGGNLAHADPHMDLPPVLAALGACVRTQSRAGVRELALEDLVCGYMETALALDELIAEVQVPTRFARHAAYAKVTTRAADDWPALGVAAALKLNDAGAVEDARVFASAAFDRPLRLKAAEQVIRGRHPDAVLLRQAGEAAGEEARPIADQHGTAAYKRALLRVHTARALQAALGSQAGAVS